MAQAVSRRLFTAESPVRARVCTWGIRVEQSGNGTDFSPSYSVFPCQCHSTMALHTSCEDGGRSSETYLTHQHEQ
jgi:hypothetical protein